MKKTLLFSRLIAIGLMMLFSSGWAFGQDWTETFDDQTSGSYGSGFTCAISGTWTASNAGNFSYANTNMGSYAATINDDKAGAHITTPALNTCGTVSFKYAYKSGSSTNIFKLQKSTNGTDFTDLDTHTLGASAELNYVDYTFDVNESSSTVYIRVLSDDQNAHLFIENFAVTSYSAGTPSIDVSETTLTDFSYEEGNGPSAEQSFTIEGSDLTADITLTPPTDYEISTGTGGAFSASNPITLTQSGGAVAQTTIYVRLKAGLAVADYNNEDITASSTDAVNKTVTCSGSVYNQLDWWNLQWPEIGTIVRGGDYIVYAQVYEAGLTDPAGQGAGITAWIGYSLTDTDPSTWTNWVAASYNSDNGNNDEYMANIGAAIAGPGVYYYASRFQMGTAPYVYGGYNGGEWDGTNNVSGVLTVTGSVSILINEVDADTQGTDALEFIELYDGGTGNTPLDGLVLVLYNGSDDKSYTPVFDLDGYSTDANGYFVIGNAAVENVDLVFADNSLQNGADAVALFYGDDTDFPNDTPITTTNLIDAMVYGTDDSDDAGLLVLLNASQPQVDEGVWPYRETVSNQRITNGSGGARNTVTYIQATPTPGAKNVAETEWTGADDNVWSNPLNWSNGLPTSDYNALVSSGATVVISGSAICNVLEIDAGGSVTVEVGGTLTPDGNTGGIIVNSDASASGSLIVLGTLESVTNKSTALAPGSTITYNRYIADNQWHLISAPVSGQSISGFLSNGDNSIVLTGDDYSMKNYDVANDNWNGLYTAATAATAGNMLSNSGYAVTRSAAGTVTMEGEYASSSVNSSLSAEGNRWNLVGNPYPSAIAANTTADATNNILTANADDLDPNFTALYVWDYVSNSYLIINHASVSPSATLAQDYIQAGQGFFVRSKDIGLKVGTSITMNTLMQSNQPAVAFKSDADEWPSITLLAKANEKEANTQIAFNALMTKGLDVGYDAGMFGGSEFEIYSRLLEDNGVNIGLQALPEDYDNLIIPIGLDAKAGELITFTAKSLNIPEDYAVVLEDRAMNIFTDLSDDAEYVVQLDNASEGTGRFFVRTSLKSALGIGDIEKGAFQVFTRVNDNQLLIRGDATANSIARIYSITGKQVATMNLDQATEQFVPFNEDSGVYILQLSNEQGTFTQKFSWVK